MESDFKDVVFWQFIGDLLAYMPTPAVQVTLFQCEIEKRNLWNPEGYWVSKEGPQLEQLIVKGTQVMKEHIELLRQNKSVTLPVNNSEVQNMSDSIDPFINFIGKLTES